MLKNINHIWFENNNLFIRTEKKDVFSQSLNDYPRLKKASDEQKAKWKLSNIGIHWQEIDEDISFESFLYTVNDPLVVKIKSKIR